MTPKFRQEVIRGFTSACLERDGEAFLFLLIHVLDQINLHAVAVTEFGRLTLEALMLPQKLRGHEDTGVIELSFMGIDEALAVLDRVLQQKDWKQILAWCCGMLSMYPPEETAEAVYGDKSPERKQALCRLLTIVRELNRMAEESIKESNN